MAPLLGPHTSSGFLRKEKKKKIFKCKVEVEVTDADLRFFVEMESITLQGW